MKLGLTGRSAVVTGSSRGIGRAIAAALADEGVRVAVSARTAVDVEATVLSLPGPGPHIGVVADLTTPEGCALLAERAADAFDGIDHLVNCVGGSGARGFDEADEADFERVLGLNLLPAVRMSRLAVPHMRRRGGGAIVHIASIYGREAGGGLSYNAVKAAEISLAKSMARDLAKDSIRVNSVAPGSIMFPGGGWERRQAADPAFVAALLERDLPFGRFGRPEEVAAAVTFLLSEPASWISGICLPVDGGQSRAF